MISKEEVKHIAKLARISISEKEVEKLQKDLSSILDYFDLLKTADVSDVEPIFHTTENFMKTGREMRNDEIKSFECKDGLVDLDKDRYIKVKAVLK